MSKNEIIAATRKDIPQLIALENSCFSSDQLHYQNFYKLIKSESAYVFVFKQSRQLIAYMILLTRKNSKRIRLYSVAVHQAHRRKGIAQQLYRYIEKKFRTRYETIYLEVNSHNRAAIRSYTQNGYQIYGHYDQYYENGDSAFRMEKHL